MAPNSTETKVYEVILVPPDDQPQTFEDIRRDGSGNPILDDNGNQIQITRPYMQHVTLRAQSEEAARFMVERNAMAIAAESHLAEAATDPGPDATDEQIAAYNDARLAASEDIDSIRAKQWVVQSIEVLEES